jgi:hypothetical protein
VEAGDPPGAGLTARKAVVLAIVATMAIIAGAVVWSTLQYFVGPPNQRPEVATSVYAAVVDAADGGTVDMPTAAPFEWDRMYAFGAYTSDDYVSQVLGFSWGTGDSLRLPDDAFLLLIFARERSVTGWVVLNDYQSNGPLVLFDNAILGMPIARADAVFEFAHDAVLDIDVLTPVP